jgi:phage terminase small subunit
MAKAVISPKMEIFCQEYLVDMNATQAAIRAGYSKKTAQAQSSRLLSKVIIGNRIKELLEAKTSKLDLSAERILTELARIAYADMRTVARWTHSGVEFIPSDQLTDDAAATVREISEETNQHGGSLKVKQHDKVKALELLGKYRKLFTEKVEHTGKVTIEDLVAGSKEAKT